MSPRVQVDYIDAKDLGFDSDEAAEAYGALFNYVFVSAEDGGRISFSLEEAEDVVRQLQTLLASRRGSK